MPWPPLSCSPPVVLAAGGAAPASAATPKVSSLDRMFVVEAGQGGAFEIAAGKLAAAHAAGADVKTFGARMVVDQRRDFARTTLPTLHEHRAMVATLLQHVRCGADEPAAVVGD